MHNPDWKRVEELFHRAHEEPPEALDAWLEAQTADPAIREEVRSLLLADQRHAELSSAVPSPDPAPPAAWADPLARLGPYQTERLLGRGGMGVVYLARRADGRFEQTVAIKLMAAHLAGEDFVRKFRTECQVLARLAHPNITRLFDGGVSASGDPYLVMEYVEGQPLDRYCDQNKLPIESRLHLFLQVCEAVDFAHHNLVLHRDLKPGNVLVTPDGAVKLLDFGTASLMGDQGGVTVTGVRMLTPRYASPEEFRGERSGIAGDVFSLGVMLYELLTGSWPFGNADSMVSELERITGKASPTFPSSAVTEDAAALRSLPKRRLQRLLKGDLSAIALKALENDPQRRYDTVRKLADDLRAFLEGRPVQARPQTAVYRARKFVRRQWLPVGAAAAFVAAISAAAVVAAYEARAARAEALKSEQVNRFLTDMLSSAGQFNFDPKKYTVAEMLDSADRRLEKGAKSDPLIEATLRLNLALSYYALQRPEKVQFHLERAIPIFRAYRADREMAQALRLQADSALPRGEYDAAERLYEEALVLLGRLGKTAPVLDVFETKRELAELFSLLTHRRLDYARTLYRDLLAMGANNSSIPRTWLAKAMTNWSGVLLEEGKEAEADAMAQEALAVGRKEDPGGYWEFEPLYQLTVIHRRRHNYVTAKEFARQMVEVSARIGPDLETTAQAKLLWSRFAADTGESAAAAANVRQVLPLIERTNRSPSLELWHAARDAAHIMRLAGSYAEAENYARQTVAVGEAAHLTEDDPRLATSWEELGLALCGRKKYAEGIRALERAEGMYRKAPKSWAKSADAAAGLIVEMRRKAARGKR